MCPRTVYVAPSGVHGAIAVFVFFTWKATGSDATLTAFAPAAGGSASASSAATTAALARFLRVNAS
jgi:hypothetical protein